MNRPIAVVFASLLLATACEGIPIGAGIIPPVEIAMDVDIPEDLAEGGCTVPEGEGDPAVALEAVHGGCAITVSREDVEIISAHDMAEAADLLDGRSTAAVKSASLTIEALLLTAASGTPVYLDDAILDLELAIDDVVLADMGSLRALADGPVPVPVPDAFLDEIRAAIEAEAAVTADLRYRVVVADGRAGELAPAIHIDALLQPEIRISLVAAMSER